MKVRFDVTRLTTSILPSVAVERVVTTILAVIVSTNCSDVVMYHVVEPA